MAIHNEPVAFPAHRQNDQIKPGTKIKWISYFTILQALLEELLERISIPETEWICKKLKRIYKKKFSHFDFMDPRTGKVYFILHPLWFHGKMV